MKSESDILSKYISSPNYKPIRPAVEHILTSTKKYEESTPTTDAKKGVDADCLLKLLLIGDTSYAKKTFLFRVCDGSFSESFIQTMGVDFKIRHLTYRLPNKDIAGEHKDYRVKCQIWDTASQERFRNITTSFLRGAMGVFIFFNLFDQNSFTTVSTNWLPQIKEKCDWETLTVVLVGIKNEEDVEKSDDLRAVSYDEAMTLALQYGVPYVECVCSTGENVEDALSTMVYGVLEKYQGLMDAGMVGQDVSVTANTHTTTPSPPSPSRCTIG